MQLFIVFHVIVIAETQIHCCNFHMLQMQVVLKLAKILRQIS